MTFTYSIQFLNQNTIPAFDAPRRSMQQPVLQPCVLSWITTATPPPGSYFVQDNGIGKNGFAAIRSPLFQNVEDFLLSRPAIGGQLEIVAANDPGDIGTYTISSVEIYTDKGRFAYWIELQDETPRTMVAEIGNFDVDIPLTIQVYEGSVGSPGQLIGQVSQRTLQPPNQYFFNLSPFVESLFEIEPPANNSVSYLNSPAPATDPNYLKQAFISIGVTDTNGTFTNITDSEDYKFVFANQKMNPAEIMNQIVFPIYQSQLLQNRQAFEAGGINFSTYIYNASNAASTPLALVFQAIKI